MKHSGSSTFRMHESSLMDSALDSTTARLPHSLCEDSIAFILMAQSATDHIRIIRDIIQSTKETRNRLHLNIQEMKLSLSNLEHTQQRDILNTEYEMTVNANKLKSVILINISSKHLFHQIQDQQEQNTQFQQQIHSLQQDCEDIENQRDILDQKLKYMCSKTGQYQYADYDNYIQ
ncbi:unnamed protein product (macronuclear) [Paramecium tetraurelia]|uniref:Uncharacterized protein n=1 Tax=Paramecium tetraurelia TaxID=5888 RepID=A0BNZ3_PARTE|nr:uncharacterized protein GSPATT00030899001 [Paramecium tetraurelia]CAK60260.1 unnamed protein product [Paramecium tetraurelia]|eukprot:XP_001427658.1 hypothetical protein (macronuclear) [Paramecium tetraurelia strain d4-2]